MEAKQAGGLWDDNSFAAFEQVLFNFKLALTKAKTMDGLKEALNSFYVLKSHSFTFYINGSPEPNKFASLQQWYDTVTPDMEDNYVNSNDVTCNLTWDPATLRATWWTYQFKNGKIASADYCKGQFVHDPDRNGRLAASHVEIHYNFV
jgi:hypothetical protein